MGTVAGLGILVCAMGVTMVAWYRSRWLRLPTKALLEGNPRRSRALARIFQRRATGDKRLWLTLFEANALLWEGAFERAIALLDSRVLPANRGALGVVPQLVKLECLIFAERITEAKDLFEAEASALRAASDGKADAVAVSALLRFHEGDLDEARDELEQVLGNARARDPIARVADFCLAAIAHRQGRADDMRRHLEHAIARGGDSFIARWAAAQWRELFPREPLPVRATRRPLQAPRLLRELVANLVRGAGVLVFRTAPLEAHKFTFDQVMVLVVLNILVSVGLRFVGFSSGAHVVGEALVTVAAPVLLFLATGHVATRGATARGATLRLMGGFYSALPGLLVLAFVATRERPHDASPFAVELLLGAWSLALVLCLSRVVGGASTRRLLACAIVFSGTWLLPMHLITRTRVFYVPTAEMEDYREEQRDHEERIFAQAERVHAVEASLVGERSGIPDLYFVGAAGWADQDVFGREIQAARELFDARFDTRYRSVVLSNDPSTRDELPLAAPVSLRHVLKKVGGYMNREEDVLFLFATSHGSKRGLGLRFPHNAPFDDDALAPSDLRSMLGDAGIKWRVIVIAGCESGVFAGALQDDFTLVATAAASDRNSYGCASGNAYTEFGRAVFGDQLRHEWSFPTAFANAAKAIEKSEIERDLRTSRPQIIQGAAIGAKLRELEARLSSR